MFIVTIYIQTCNLSNYKHFQVNYITCQISFSNTRITLHYHIQRLLTQVVQYFIHRGVMTKIQALSRQRLGYI